MSDNRRKSDVRGWLSTVVAAVSLTGAFFAWYTNQTSKANAAEIVTVYATTVEAASKAHNDRGDSHYTYRKDTDDRIDNLSDAVIRFKGSADRIADAVDSNKSDIRELKEGQREILLLLRKQGG